MLENFDITGLVQSILTDLSVGPQPVPAVPVGSAPKVEKPVDVKPAVRSPGEVYIDRRVVSLEDVKNLSGGVSKLLISPKSILTPSAKDEIRKRKIEVAVRLPRPAADSGASPWFAVQKPAAFPDGVLSRFNAKAEVFENVAAIVESVRKQLTNGRRGVALSRQAARLLCEANRYGEIRAIDAFDPKQTAEDAAELDANLLVVHPDRVAASALSGILEVVK